MKGHSRPRDASNRQIGEQSSPAIPRISAALPRLQNNESAENSSVDIKQMADAPDPNSAHPLFRPPKVASIKSKSDCVDTSKQEHGDRRSSRSDRKKIESVDISGIRTNLFSSIESDSTVALSAAVASMPSSENLTRRVHRISSTSPARFNGVNGVNGVSTDCGVDESVNSNASRGNFKLASLEEPDIRRERTGSAAPVFPPTETLSLKNPSHLNSLSSSFHSSTPSSSRTLLSGIGLSPGSASEDILSHVTVDRYSTLKLAPVDKPNRTLPNSVSSTDDGDRERGGSMSCSRTVQFVEVPSAAGTEVESEKASANDKILRERIQTGKALNARSDNGATMHKFSLWSGAKKLNISESPQDASKIEALAAERQPPEGIQSERPLDVDAAKSSKPPKLRGPKAARLVNEDYNKNCSPAESTAPNLFPAELPTENVTKDPNESLVVVEDIRQGMEGNDSVNDTQDSHLVESSDYSDDDFTICEPDVIDSNDPQQGKSAGFSTAFRNRVGSANSLRDNASTPEPGVVITSNSLPSSLIKTMSSTAEAQKDRLKKENVNPGENSAVRTSTDSTHTENHEQEDVASFADYSMIEEDVDSACSVEEDEDLKHMTGMLSSSFLTTYPGNISKPKQGNGLQTKEMGLSISIDSAAFKGSVERKPLSNSTDSGSPILTARQSDIYGAELEEEKVLQERQELRGKAGTRRFTQDDGTIASRHSSAESKRPVASSQGETTGGLISTFSNPPRAVSKQAKIRQKRAKQKEKLRAFHSEASNDGLEKSGGGRHRDDLDPSVKSQFRSTSLPVVPVMIATDELAAIPLRRTESPCSSVLSQASDMMDGDNSQELQKQEQEQREVALSLNANDPIAHDQVDPDVQQSSQIQSGLADCKCGETLRWKRGQLIGEGTFGRVYKGLNEKTGELLAVKELFLADGTEDEIKSIRKEITLICELNHENIVRYLGTSRSERFLYIMLEFVPGGSIASMLSQYGAFSEDLLRRFSKQILSGIDYLHSKGIIHRDIKGANVLVTDSGIAKLADFGCSKQLTNMCTASLEESLRAIRGSVPWMAPEMIKQSGHGRSSDIWSFGATVIEMATAKPPWPEFSNNLAALFHVATSKDPPPCPPHLSLAGCKFLRRCLVVDAKGRASAKELLEDSFLTGETSAEMSGPSEVVKIENSPDLLQQRVSIRHDEVFSASSSSSSVANFEEMQIADDGQRTDTASKSKTTQRNGQATSSRIRAPKN